MTSTKTRLARSRWKLGRQDTWKAGGHNRTEDAVTMHTLGPAAFLTHKQDVVMLVVFNLILTGRSSKHRRGKARHFPAEQQCLLQTDPFCVAYLLPQAGPCLHKDRCIIGMLLQAHGLVVQHNIHALSNETLHHIEQPVKSARLREVGIAVALLDVVHGSNIAGDGLVPVLVNHMRANEALLQHVDSDGRAVLIQVLGRHVEVLPGKWQPHCSTSRHGTARV